MDFDFVKDYPILEKHIGVSGQKILDKTITINDAILLIIDDFEKIHPYKDWKSFRQIDYNDNEHLKNWINILFEEEPLPDETKGIWFGIFHPVDKHGRVRSDLMINGTSKFEPEDGTGDWACAVNYTPEKYDTAHSQILRKIYSMAYFSEFGLGNLAEMALCLPYSIFAVIELLRDINLKLVLNNNPGLGIGAGFNEGDYNVIGILNPSGLKLM